LSFLKKETNMKKSLLLLGLLASLNANANLINNGGFEEYTVGAGTSAHISTSGTCSTLGVTCIANNNANFAWGPTIGAPNEFLEVRDTFFGTAVEGSNFAELNPAAPSGIVQSFLADAGFGTLSWFDKGRFGDGYKEGNYSYSVLLNNNEIFNGLTTSITDWTQLTINNVALLQGTNTLSFVSSSTEDVGAQIDNVSLTQVAAVPEPETYGMMMLGLAMLGFASRRRKD